MTISTTAPRAVFNCDGTSKVFPVPIQAYLPTDFLVIHTQSAALGGGAVVLVLNSDYSLSTSGSLNPTAWTLTTLAATAFPAQDSLQVILNPVQSQQTQYVQGQAFPSLAVQTNVDRLTQMVQRLQDEVSRCIRAPDGDVSPAMLLPSAIARELTFPMFDAAGNLQVGTVLPAGTLSAATIGAFLYPRSQAEISALVVPTAMQYAYGRLERYGGDPTGAADSSVAWAALIAVLGQASGQLAGYICAGSQFKIITGAVYTGANPITIRGEGQTSQLLCDGLLLSCTGGASYSTLDNIALYNITAPWIITRNPANWAANVLGTLQQSNTVLGYQPTINDQDLWSSLTAPQQNQQIGPVLFFSGAALGITVSRIYGRFVRVEIRDASYSTIRDCDIRGGKGQWGALEFDNWTNGVARGVGNRALNNRVGYASFTGTFFSANDDFTNSGNHIYRCGESGTKTLQAQGVVFSANVSGLTAATIVVPGGGLTNGVWTFIFGDASVRSVTVTGGTACAWAGALGASFLQSATAYQTALNPQCFRGVIEDNHCYQMYFDGLDCDSTFGTTVDAAQTFHQINNNYSYNNGGDGMNADGQFNTYVGNHLYANNDYGFWGVCSNSEIVGNHIIGNNRANSGSSADLLAGSSGNSLIGNRIVYTASAGFSIYGVQSAPPAQVGHVATDNVVQGGTAFWGNTGAIYAVLANNIDATTGPRTRQSGLFFIKNSGGTGSGTIQHVFFNDIGETSAANASRITANSSGGFTNTPTGTDATTAPAAGAKISTTDTNGVIFDTAAQWNGDVDFEARIVINATGTALSVSVSFESFAVWNGTAAITRFRPVLRFWNATTGAAFVLNNTNIPGAGYLQVAFSGYLS